MYNPRVLRRVDQLLRELKPDVVHANNVHYYLSWAALAVAKKYAPVVWTARDAMAVCYGKLDTPRYLDHLDARISWRDNLKVARRRFNPLRSPFIKHYLREVNARYAVSEALASALGQNGVSGVETIHTGIDPKVWQALPEAVAAFKEQFGLAGKRVILFGGRLSSEKGGGRALEALGEVVEALPEATLLVAGPADGYAALSREAGRRGITGHLTFTGWIGREDMKAAYATAELVWVPSLYLDPFPRIVLEAMASGTPVVGTCFGGAREAILDGVTGFVVDPRNSHEMARRTLELLNDHTQAHTFGQAARERVEEHFGLAQYAASYCAAYQQARGPAHITQA